MDSMQQINQHMYIHTATPAEAAPEIPCNHCLLQEEVLLESRRSSHSEASSSSSPLQAGAPEHVHGGPAAEGGHTGLLPLEATLEHAVEAGIDASMAALDAGAPARNKPKVVAIDYKPNKKPLNLGRLPERQQNLLLLPASPTRNKSVPRFWFVSVFVLPSWAAQPEGYLGGLGMQYSTHSQCDKTYLAALRVCSTHTPCQFTRTHCDGSSHGPCQLYKDMLRLQHTIPPVKLQERMGGEGGLLLRNTQLDP